MLAEDDSSPCGCRPVLTGYGLTHAKPLDVAESPSVARGAEIAYWSPERLIDAENTKVPHNLCTACSLVPRALLRCCRPGPSGSSCSLVRCKQPLWAAACFFLLLLGPT